MLNRTFWEILIIVLLFIGFPIWAVDIKSEGFGATQEEARVNARANLSGYINGIFVDSQTETYLYDDSITYEKTFSSNTATSSSGYLKAVEYSNEHKNGSLYYSTALIKDSSSNLSAFVDALKKEKTTIETLYKSLSQQNNEQKKNTLITLYATLAEYEAYRTILVYMGHADQIPELSIKVTTTSVYIEYQNIIIEEGYELEEKEKYVTDETEHQKLLEELSANRSEQRRLEREKNEAQSAREEAAKLALAERLKQYSLLVQTEVKMNTTTDETRYNSLRDKISSTRDIFLNKCIGYDKLCKEQFALIDSDYDAEKSAVEARPYRYAELDGEVPTPAAKQIREDEINYLYSLKEMHKVAVFKQIRDAMLESIKASYNDYVNALNGINYQTFEITLDENKIDYVVVSFDSINTKWIVEITLSDEIEGLENRTFKIEIAYPQLMGKDIQTPKYRGQKGYEDYMAYLDDIDYLDNVIRDFQNSFRIYLRFRTYVNKAKYGIEYNGIDFKSIQFVLESNAVASNPDWAVIISSSPSAVVTTDLQWNLPGYSRTFNREFV